MGRGWLDKFHTHVGAVDAAAARAAITGVLSPEALRGAVVGPAGRLTAPARTAFGDRIVATG